MRPLYYIAEANSCKLYFKDHRLHRNNRYLRMGSEPNPGCSQPSAAGLKPGTKK